MASEKKVIDASVVAKWFLEEEGSSQARALRDAHVRTELVLLVPEIVFIEVMNALRYKKNSVSELKKAITSLLGMQLQVEKLTDFVLARAVQIAVEYDLSVYDGLYAALSQIHGVPLVTADKALQRFPNAELLDG